MKFMEFPVACKDGPRGIALNLEHVLHVQPHTDDPDRCFVTFGARADVICLWVEYTKMVELLREGSRP